MLTINSGTLLSKITAMKALNNNLKAIVCQKCPVCHKGDVFVPTKKLFQMPVMHENCPNCRYHYDREPGYFLGAMYVSYGLGVFEGILMFLTIYFLLPSLSTIYYALAVVAAIIGFSLWNYRMSRVVWMYLFPN